VVVGCCICDECAAATAASDITPLQEFVSSMDIVQEEQQPELVCPICDVQGAFDSKALGPRTRMSGCVWTAQPPSRQKRIQTNL
jgi:hypothetical protein